MATVDLNCDMGESFGAYTIGDDPSLMEFVTSVNIACGFHAGDPSVMKRTVNMAAEKGIAIGAHPGYPDLQGFGRREMKLTAEEVYDLVVYQVGALDAFVKISGSKLHHVKPHGALYNMAAREPALANAIVSAVKDYQPTLHFVGLAGSALTSEAAIAGLNVMHEVFADRTYQDDGTLTPRTHKNSIIYDEQQSIDQVLRMVRNGQVKTLSGKIIDIRADTICIHGDGREAVRFAKKIVNTLREHDIHIRRP